MDLWRAIIAQIRNPLVENCRFEHHVGDETGLRLVRVLAAQLVEEPLERVDLELVEGRTNVVGHLVHLVVVVAARCEALEEQHGLFGDHVGVALLDYGLIHLDLLGGERVRVLPIPQMSQPMEPDLEETMAVSLCDEVHRAGLLSRVSGDFEQELRLECAAIQFALICLLMHGRVDRLEAVD